MRSPLTENLNRKARSLLCQQCLWVVWHSLDVICEYNLEKFGGTGSRIFKTFLGWFKWDIGIKEQILIAMGVVKLAQMDKREFMLHSDKEFVDILSIDYWWTNYFCRGNVITAFSYSTDRYLVCFCFCFLYLVLVLGFFCHLQVELWTRSRAIVLINCHLSKKEKEPVKFWPKKPWPWTEGVGVIRQWGIALNESQ